MFIPRQLLFAASLAAAFAAPAQAQVILNEYNAVRADRWLAADGATASSASDSYFGRVRGNGGRWFEVLVVGSTDAPGEKVDLRGWTFSWTTTNAVVGSASFTLSQDLLLSAIDRGTLITFFSPDTGGPDVGSNLSGIGASTAAGGDLAQYDPANGNWWLNINLADTSLVGSGTLITHHDDWQLTIKDNLGNLVFGPVGEGVGSLSGVNSREVGKLETSSNTIDDWQEITPLDLAYQDGTSSTFGAPNTWSGGASVQNFSVLRNTGTAVTFLWKNGDGGTGTWAVSGGTEWSGGAWNPAATGIFQGAPGTVTLGGALAALGLEFLTSGYVLTNGSLQVNAALLTAAGVTTTLATPLAGPGLTKTGAGTLVLDAGSTELTGTVNLEAGVLRLARANALPAAVRATVAAGATLDLAGFDLTLSGLGGTGTTSLGSGRLTILGGAGNAVRGPLTGSGGVTVTGAEGDSIRFLDTDKTYTGSTIITGGNLRVATFGLPTHTSAVSVTGGELTLTSASGFYEFGFPAPALPVIALSGGALGNENNESVDLYNPVDVTGTGSTIFSRGRGDGETTLDGEFHLQAELTGDGELRKSGQGALHLHADNTGFTGTWNIRNGTVIVEETANFGTAPQLQFTDSANQRRLVLAGDQTVSLLAATAAEAVLDPETGEVVTPAGTAVVALAAGATLIIDQDEAAAPLDGEGNPLAGTRFQGSLTGAGSVAKTGTGLVEFTRGPNDFSGSLTITRGVLAFSQPAAPATLSALTVAPGGQLRLTSGSSEAEPVRLYDFGAIPLQLAGPGRDGVEAEAGKGIAGALRYEPGGSDNTAAVANALSLADGTALHVSGSTSTLILQGALAGSGGTMTKNGGGRLSLAAANPGLAHAWSVVNGTLHIAAGATSGSGLVTVGPGAVLAGDGSTGSIVMDEGGTLQAGALVSTGTFTAAPGSLLAVDPATAAGTYTVLTASGGVNGATNLAVTGLEETDFTGTVAADGNTLVLTVAAGSGEVAFSAWGGGVAPGTDVNGNGYTALAEFALGASAPGASVPVPVRGATSAGGTNYLTLTATVRTNGTGLTVTGQSAANLAATNPWTAADVDFVPTGATDVPDGCEERLYRTPADSTRKFLRLIMELAP
jgi:autotransporter-associated beta strand protein